MEVVGFHPTSQRTDLVGGHALNELPRRQTSAVRSRLLKKIEKTTLAARCDMSAMLNVIRRPEPFRCRVVAPVEQGSTSLPHWLTEADVDFYVSEFARTGFRGGAELVPQHRSKLGTLSACVWSAGESPGAVHRRGPRSRFGLSWDGPNHRQPVEVCTAASGATATLFPPLWRRRGLTLKDIGKVEVFEVSTREVPALVNALQTRPLQFSTSDINVVPATPVKR